MERLAIPRLLVLMFLMHLIRHMLNLWNGRQTEMKVPKLLIYTLSITVPLFFICMGLIASGKVSMDIDSFALDSNGNLYVGKLLKIEVFKDDSLLRTISPMPRDYRFTIDQNDSIVLSDGSNIYVMDLTGDVLSQREDQFSEIYSELKNKKTFVSKSGERYLKRNSWGRVEIVNVVNNNEVAIYKMPLLDYIVLILFWSIQISIFILTPFIFLQWKRMMK
jgi:hypothetical protein